MKRSTGCADSRQPNSASTQGNDLCAPQPRDPGTACVRAAMWWVRPSENVDGMLRTVGFMSIPQPPEAPNNSPAHRGAGGTRIRK